MKKTLTIAALLVLLEIKAEPPPTDFGPPEVEAVYALETISITPPAPSYGISYGTNYVRRPIER